MATVGQATPGLTGVIAAIQQLIAALMTLVAALSPPLFTGRNAAATSSGSTVAAAEATANPSDAGTGPTYAQKVKMEAPAPKPWSSSHAGAGPTKTPTVEVDLPEGVASLDQWSQTQLDFGKHSGLSYKTVYIQMPSYINWIQVHCADSKNPEMQDFINWIQLQDQQPQGPKMTFPNSTKTRRYVNSAGTHA